MSALQTRLRDELDHVLVDAHGVPEDERVEWAARLTRAVLDVAAKVHARHDLGHKLGAWPKACALCEAVA